MKKKIISLGLLATVLSFTSCVKDNESDSVVAQRQAQTEKLKAEAKQALSNAGLVDAQAKVQEAILKIKEQEVALKELEVVKQKALDAYELALAKEQHEVKLLKKKKALLVAEGALEIAKSKLEEDKQTAWKALEDLKLTIIKEKDQVAQAIKNYEGTKDREALANVEKKYNEYSLYMNQLETTQGELITAKQGVINAEYGLVDVKVQKEIAIKQEERNIVSYKKQIEFLKQYSYYSNDIAALNVKLAEAKEKAGKAKDYADNVAAPALAKIQTEFSKENNIWASRGSKFKFFEAEYSNLYAYVITNGNDRKFKYVKVEKEGHAAWKIVYDINYLPTLDLEKYNLKIDDYDLQIKNEKDDLTKNLEPKKKTAYDNMVAKKKEYDKDKSDATNRKAYEKALEDYRKASQAVKNKKGDISNIEARKSGLQSMKDQFTNADNQKAVKDYLENLNKLETERVEADLNSMIAYTKYNNLNNEYNDLQTIKSGALSIENQINRLKQYIKNAERNIADLSGVQNQEQLVAIEKAKVVRLEQKIELLNKKVEVAKKAYEDALAAL